MLPATGTTPAAPREAASALVSELRGIDWLHLLEAWGLRLLAAVAIFVAGRWLAQRLGNGLDRVMARAGVDPTLGGFLRNIARRHDALNHTVLVHHKQHATRTGAKLLQQFHARQGLRQKHGRLRVRLYCAGVLLAQLQQLAHADDTHHLVE